MFTQTECKQVKNHPKNSVAQKVKRCKKDVVNLKRVNVRSFLEKTKGKIFSVKFTKQDGQQRKMVCRTGVTAYLNGGVNKVERADRAYFTIFELQIAQYRTINLDTISEIRVFGKIWAIIE